MKESTLKAVRTIHGSMLAAVLLLALTAERLSGTSESAERIFVVVIGVLSILEVSLALFFRKTFVIASTERLRIQPSDTDALTRWKIGSILVSGFSLTVAMFGFVLRVLGAPLSQSLPFYVLAAVLLLLWWPRLDLD